MKERKSLRSVRSVPLTVRSRRFSGDFDFERRVSRRLNVATRQFSDRIRSIVVCLDDINGTRGGIDNMCRLQMALKHGGVIHARGLGRTPEAAVAAAAPRARTMLVRSLGRRRSRRTRY